MATKKSESTLTRKGCMNSFNLIGKAVINDYTFNIDKASSQADSNWIYNSLNLGVDCGKNGIVYAEMMGGYDSKKPYDIKVYGKDENGKDDYDNEMTIAWEDRLDEDYVSQVASTKLISVGIEKDKNGKTFVREFLSEYDAIAYLNENLKTDTIVNIKGSLVYSIYQGKTTVKKKIKSIFLSKVENAEDFKAGFTQTILITKDSVGKIDKEKCVLPIYAFVIDYMSKYNNHQIKDNVVMPKTFEYACDMTDMERLNKQFVKLFKVKKDVTQITFEGEFYEGGSSVTATVDDLPDDIKELLELGVYTEEQALSACTVGSTKEKRMVLTIPYIKIVEDKEKNKTPVLQKFESKYKEEEIAMTYTKFDESNDDDDEENFENDVSQDNDDFLKALGI